MGIKHMYQLKMKATGAEYYFSSLAAIYVGFSSSEIGCGVGTLWRRKITDGNTYENKKCTIRRVEVNSKPQTKKAGD